MARDGITKIISPSTGKPSYRSRISWIGHDGERKHRSKTFSTKREAERWRRDTLAAVDKGDYFEALPTTVGEVADRWLRTVTRSLAPSTIVQYRHTWDHILAPRLAHRKAASVLATDVQSIYDELGTTYRANTVRMCHKVLRGIFSHAVTDGIVQVDPTAGRRLPTDRSDPPSVWTADETRRFLFGVEHHPHGPLFAVLVTTGIRLGEAQALRWSDIDLEARTMAITRTAQVTPEGWTIAERPKTGRSVRTVVLPAQAVLALHRQRAMADDRVAFVFPGQYGNQLPGETARRRLGKLCKLAGVPQLTPHELRGTCATLMMERGVHPSVASAQLGHSIETMLAKYTQVSTTMQRQAAASLDDILALPEVDRNSGGE